MAKRGKKGKRGKGKKKEKKAKDMTEVTREMYEITVKDLTEKLERSKSKCHELQEANDELNARYSQLSTDLSDVISYLKLRLEQKRDELTELTERLEGLDAQRTLEQQECRETKEKLQNDMKKMQTELTSEIQMLSSKLTSLEEFRRTREKLFQEKDALEERLEEERHLAEEKLYEVDKQRIIDNDKLKKEAVKKITGVANAFQEATGRRIHQTTLRTIQENICLTSQMALVAERAQELDAQNEALRAGAAESSRLLESLEWTERSLVSATLRHEAELRQLEARNRELAEQLRESQGREAESGGLSRQLRALEGRLARQQRLLQSAAAAQQQHQQLIGQLGQQLQQESGLRARLEQLLGRAASVVREAVRLTPDRTGGQARQGLLEQLLDLLTAASLRDQQHRLLPLDQLTSEAGLGLLPGRGALKLRPADTIVRELELVADEYGLPPVPAPQPAAEDPA